MNGRWLGSVLLGRRSAHRFGAIEGLAKQAAPMLLHLPQSVIPQPLGDVTGVVLGSRERVGLIGHHRAPQAAHCLGGATLF